MALELSRQKIELEGVAGTRVAQALTRAEALVPGAGREAIEVLLADASVALDAPEAQADRVVVEGEIVCQAVYRQGGEPAPRALSARARLSQVFEMPGVQPGMAVSACAVVEHVDARYENGHMVFLATTAMWAQATYLTPAEIVDGITGAENLEAEYAEICSCKASAESQAATLCREEVTLPAALDARTALMDWGAAYVTSSEADLGGIRVRGKVNVVSLISSGVPGRPAAELKYTLDFDQLVDVPEWLCRDVCAGAELRSLETRVEQGGEGEDSALIIEAEVGVKVLSLGRDCVNALTGVYSTLGARIDAENTTLETCLAINCASCTDQVKGTLLLSENAPGVGSVITVIARPNVSGWATNGESAIEGVIEATVLYMPGGSDSLASARSELPFSVKCPGTLNDTSMVCVEVLSAEASALMSDRVELRCTLNITARTREKGTYDVVSGAKEGENVKKRPGIILFWPSAGDSLWSIGRRYNVPVEEVRVMNGGSEIIEADKALVLKI